jgi:O-antigen ligase
VDVDFIIPNHAQGIFLMDISSVKDKENLLPALSKFLWVLFLVALPVTSFPFFPGNIGGGTLVRPLSIYPLIILLVLIILPRFFSKPLPKTILAFLPFAVVAVAATILATLRGIEGLQGISVTTRMFRALTTLGIGGAIYLTVTLWPNNQDELKFSLRWLYIGFGLALLWGSLQALYIVFVSQPWFEIMSRIQGFISIRRLFINRVSGLTYEPNWFADQISLLLLPWLLAAVFSSYTVFKWRWRWLTIELMMLIWALALLPFTFSRAGLLVMFVLVFISVLFFRSKKAISVKQFPLRTILEGFLLVVVLASVVFVAGTRNEFFARIWEYWQRKPDQGYVQYFVNYFEYLGFGARYSYWQTAYHVYEDNPTLGVGLGNYAFYFDEKLPERPLATIPEVLRLVVPEEGGNRLITPKNLYLRIMAETGLLGLATFLGFLMAILGCALYLWLSPHSGSRYFGTGGLLGLIAFILVAFSFDSFAIPNMWVVFGLITAAMRIWKASPHLAYAGENR